jgi:hypothetical protein
MTVRSRYQEGSILVGVVLFCTVLSIAGATMLAMSGNANGNLMNSVDDQKRFFAAEAGLSLGIAWVRGGGLPIGNQDMNPGTLNGFPVTIRVQPDGWIIATVPNSTPTATAPLQWKQEAKCQVTVSNIPVAHSISRSGCSNKAIAVTFP